MNTQILNGKKLAEEIIENFKNETITDLKLATILIGEDYASELYVSLKKKKCESLGISFELIKFSEDIEEKEVINKIELLNKDNSVTGILIQLPLPEKLNTKKILTTILPEKDVDGLTPTNLGLIMTNLKGIVSPTAKGIIRLIKEYGIDLEGKGVVIVGSSFLIGRPLGELLLNNGATVTICHSKTKDLSKHTIKADILISSTGIPHIIKKEMVKSGVIVIDVGISKLNGKLIGDVDFENIKEITSYITPVPGGVGPMTIAMLIENLLEIKKKI